MKKQPRVGPLVIIGGREDKEREMWILTEVVRLAGGSDARIVIMPVASQYPDEVGSSYVDVFGRLGASEVEVAKVSAREDAMDPCIASLVERSTAVFFTGGSQIRITSLLGGSPIDEIMCRRQREDGLVVAGTSAGAAIMAGTMIVRGVADTSPRLGGVVLGSGMGFVSGTLIDQHFAERGRIGRLIAAVAQHPRYLGLGIDEDTAVVVEGERFRVIGVGSVTVVDAADMTYTNFPEALEGQPLALENIKVAVVPNGYGFDLACRRLLPPADRGEGRPVG
jgi:cyanophycinase